MRRIPVAILLACVWFGICSPAEARLDMSRASVEILDNGLQVIVLEENTLPVVSVQMLYRVGARNEQYGLTGISHYLEHMAFRATENFPDTGVVSEIYAVGGEWHGYTWIDQTVYFETLPSGQLDLALRIEADRMQRLLIPGDEVGLERGAIFTEMHSYENDPANTLRDSVIASSLLAHPYRNNVVGIESDINNIQKADLVALYKRHYHSGNAVLTIIGDIDKTAVMHRVRSLFGRFDRTGAVALPATVEPRQNGERRINLVTASEQQYFEVAYHAPAVHDDDFVAFLVLREIIGGSTGLNFQHDSGFSSVREGAYLDPGMTTWFHPTRQPFLFTISAEVPAGNSQAEFEKSVEQNLVRLREEPVSPATLEHARRQLLRELVFDVETTEDAAHQLGYFAGLDALNVLLELPQAVAAINIADIQRVARRFLVPSQRTTGWLMPSAEARKVLAANPARELASPVNHQGTPTGNEPVKRATAGVSFLSEGMPVIVKQHTLSDSAYLSVVYPAAGVGLDGHVAAAGLVSGHTIQEFQVLPGELDDAIKHARKSLGQAGFEDAKPRVASNDPGLRLSQAIDQASAFEAVRPEVPPAPALIVAVGNFDPGMVLGRLESAFGDIAPAAAPGRASPVQRAGDLDVKTVLPRSQGQIGYVIPAPAPGSNDYDAWRIALYIFSHDYEGRLGRKVISQAGLLYWIDSGYETDGQHGRIVIRAGVDPSRMASVKRLFHAELARLESDPPTELEIAEARNHFLGRRQSAAQSNTEIAHRLMRDWLARGEIVSMESLRTRLDAVGREDVIRILPAFCAGSVITVNVEGISSWPAK